MKKYYHVCSLGLEKNLLFSDDQDFVTGVNDIAISLLKFDIKLICYCLMSNHFHFILYGEKQVCPGLPEPSYRPSCQPVENHRLGGSRKPDVKLSSSLI